ncbi:MAG: hypothetical protein AAGF71_10370 [Pseudomonadota bacterium]
MTERDDCLHAIGEIAVRWSGVEKNLKDLLWLYVGTDRQTFDLLFGGASGDQIAKVLRRVVEAKEVDAAAKSDAIEALNRCQVLRQNCNTILHKMRSDHMDDASTLLPSLSAAKDSLVAYSEALSNCCERLSLFVARRDALETPDGVEEAPDAEERVPIYIAVAWPTKTKLLKLEDRL